MRNPAESFNLINRINMFKNGKLINTSCILFAIAGIILILGKTEWFPDFYNPDFMGGAAFLAVILILLPVVIFRTNNAKKKDARRSLQIKIAIALFLNAFGALGLFKLYTFGFEYDKFVHFLVAFLLSGEAYYFFCVWYGWNRKKAMAISAAIILISGIVWEPVEFLLDIIFGTQTFGLYGKEVPKDTLVDIFCNFLGVFLGLAVTFLKKKEKV